MSGWAAPSLNGDPVTVVPGQGVMRIERGERDAWVIPVELDTLVYRPTAREHWRYPEVYRRER